MPRRQTVTIKLEIPLPLHGALVKQANDEGRAGAYQFEKFILDVLRDTVVAHPFDRRGGQ